MSFSFWQTAHKRITVRYGQRCIVAPSGKKATIVSVETADGDTSITVRTEPSTREQGQFILCNDLTQLTFSNDVPRETLNNSDMAFDEEKYDVNYRNIRIPNKLPQHQGAKKYRIFYDPTPNVVVKWGRGYRQPSYEAVISPVPADAPLLLRVAKGDWYADVHPSAIKNFTTVTKRALYRVYSNSAVLSVLNNGNLPSCPIGGRRYVIGTRQSKNYMQTTGARGRKLMMHKIVAGAWYKKEKKNTLDRIRREHLRANSVLGIDAENTTLIEVNHKDGYKWNNRKENLEWCTPGENNDDRYMRQCTNILIRTGRLIGITERTNFKTYVLDPFVDKAKALYDHRRPLLHTASWDDRHFDTVKYKTGAAAAAEDATRTVFRTYQRPEGGLYRVYENGDIEKKLAVGKWSLLKKTTSGQGYTIIDGLRAHRIVAHAWYPEENKLAATRMSKQQQTKPTPPVNHKDGYRSNNRIENLEWCTPKENFDNLNKRQCVNVIIRRAREQARSRVLQELCVEDPEVPGDLFAPGDFLHIERTQSDTESQYILLGIRVPNVNVDDVGALVVEELDSALEKFSDNAMEHWDEYNERKAEYIKWKTRKRKPQRKPERKPTMGKKVARVGDLASRLECHLRF